MPSPGSTPRVILSRAWRGRTLLLLLLAAPALSASVYVGRLRMSRAWWGRNVLLLLLAAPALSASVHVGRMAPKIKLTYFNIEGVAEVIQGPSPRAQILQNCTSYALLALSGQGRCPACVCAAHAHLVCKRTFSHRTCAFSVLGHIRVCFIPRTTCMHNLRLHRLCKREPKAFRMGQRLVVPGVEAEFRKD
jgi:hypothetical protein